MIHRIRQVASMCTPVQDMVPWGHASQTPNGKPSSQLGMVTDQDVSEAKISQRPGSHDPFHRKTQTDMETAGPKITPKGYWQSAV